MLTPIAVQLYSVREAMAQDAVGVLTRIAEIGYSGVEAVLSTSKEGVDTLQVCKDLGLQIPSIHAGLPFDAEKQEALERAASFGCRYAVVASLPPASFQTRDLIEEASERLNEANAIARQHGLTLGYHNHWWEFDSTIDEKTPHEVLHSYLDPTVIFELDTYWIQVAGVNPTGVIKYLGSQAPLLHIKDGPVVKHEPMVAVGDGVMDIPAVVHAGDGTTEWLVVELDACATDMVEAVAKSYQYLVSRNLGTGKK